MVHNTGEPIMTLFKSIFNSGTPKFFGCLATGLATIFTPIAVAVSCALIFVLIDAIYGYKVSRKYGRTHLESNKLWKTLNKATESFIMITLAHLLDTYVITSLSLHLVEIVTGAICFSEFISLLESFIDLHPKGPWKLLKNIIKAKGEKYLDVKIDETELNDNIDDIKTDNQLGKQ